MKRTICILLIVVLSLSLASCGSSDDEYTYDYLQYDFPMYLDTNSEEGVAVKGGAYLSIPVPYLEGDAHQGVCNTIRCIFNEETKVFMPLCWDVNCDHTTLDCFGKLYRVTSQQISDIYEGEIFVVDRSSEVRNQLEVTYYSLDGTVRDTVEYIPELTMPSGEVLDDIFSLNSSDYITYGTKLYFDVSAEVLGSEASMDMDQSQVEHVHWIVSYDLEKKKWDLFTSIPYLMPNNLLDFNDVKDAKISFTEEGIGYTVDLVTGETEIFDCVQVLDEMIAEGTLPVGTVLHDVYPLRDCFTCRAEKYSYYKISTREAFDRSKVTFTTGTRKFVYNGEPYSFSIRMECTNLKTGEQTPLVLDGKYLAFFSETENGIIYRYINYLEDGSLEPDTYTVKEGGKDVTYWYPQKYVYVTKEDILDGNIDEPWYYDAETYSFVQR